MESAQLFQRASSRRRHICILVPPPGPRGPRAPCIYAVGLVDDVHLAADGAELGERGVRAPAVARPFGSPGIRRSATTRIGWYLPSTSTDPCRASHAADRVAVNHPYVPK